MDPIARSSTACFRCAQVLHAALALLTVLAMPAVAAAATLLVPAQYPTLGGALNAAADGDTILISPGTYTGPGNCNLDFAGKAIVVQSLAGPDSCIVDCQGAGRGFLFQSGETDTTVLRGVTVRGATATRGAAIFASGSSPLIEHCRFENNVVTDDGGAVYCFQSSPDFVLCDFEGNQADLGGAIANVSSDPDILNCSFAGNFAALEGGAIRNEASSPVVVGCRFQENVSSGDGGGVANADGTALYVSCRFELNLANGFGGGMVNGSPTRDGGVRVVSCTFLGNGAADGAGIMNWHGQAEIVSSVFRDNQANQGGGIYSVPQAPGAVPRVANCLFADNTAYAGAGLVISGNLEIVSSTITGNSAGIGGALACLEGQIAVANSILWNNTAGKPSDLPGDLAEELFVSGAATLSVDYSLVRGNLGDLLGGTGNVEGDRDPRFADPNGADFHLSAYSPAIDAGLNSALPANLDFDLDGNPRFTDDPSVGDVGSPLVPIVDLGAYEYQGVSCHAGTVNRGAGPLTDVLSVNGSTGGSDRRVIVPRQGALHVEMLSPPQGEGRGRYALWVWAGEPATPTDLTVQGELIGCTAGPTPLSALSPRPAFAVLGTNLPDALAAGTRQIPGPMAAPWEVARPQGLNRDIVFTLQALVEDQGADNALGFSITNAVILDVRSDG